MLLVGVLLGFLSICDGAKILGIFNHPGASHTFLGKILLKNLAKKGHEIVMISAFPMEEPIPNYRDIELTGFLEDLHRREMMYFNKDRRSEIANTRNLALQHTENTFTHPNVKSLLSSNETFDLVIIDYFVNEGLLMFGHIYQAPVIVMSSFGNNILLNGFTGNTLPFSYVPGGAVVISDDIPFKYRVFMAIANFYMEWVTPQRLEAYSEILKKYFDNPPSLYELQENIALVLSNSHFSIESPRPYTPNIIPVAGLHLEEPKDLPEDLQNYLDSAEHGVIFFSLGSQIKSANLNKDKLKQILNVFSKLPQNILWKYESDDLADVPSNVKIQNWVPQLDLLAHPNVKLFISHCGMLSLIEAVNFHVPILCMPFNGDQMTNAAFVESRGIGHLRRFEDITEENFLETLTKLTTNPRYQEKANYFSSLLRDQPLSPLKTAIYWVEHVIKYKGAPHLKSFATKLPLYKYYMLDVIGLFLVIFWVIYKLTFYMLKKGLLILLSGVRKLQKVKIH